MAIKICKELEVGKQLVRHLSKKISRFTKFLLDLGAAVIAALLNTLYLRLPFVSGDLEIPCVFEAKLIGKKNKEAPGNGSDLSRTV